MLLRTRCGARVDLHAADRIRDLGHDCLVLMWSGDLNDFFLDEGIVYPIATNIEKCLASSKVKDIGHRRIPLFKFTETWLDA